MSPQLAERKKLRELQKISAEQLNPNVVKRLPWEFLKKQCAIPIQLEGGEMAVALADPLNVEAYDAIVGILGRPCPRVLCPAPEIEQAISRCYYYAINTEEKYYSPDAPEGAAGGAETTISTVQTHAEDLLSIAQKAPPVQLVNKILFQAMQSRASDIHVEPYAKILRLRYRIDGVLQEMTPPPKKFQNAIISRIKILSEMDIAERRLPQDGRFKVKAQNRSIDFRVSSCPTVHGEKIVIRILDQSALMVNLTDLGFDPQVLKMFETAIRRPYGMMLVTGPTGSGKSTTLYSALSTINDPRKNIMTIEDPVEYQLKGINQVQAKPEIGLTFASGLRSFLRQDPDIIMVGEIRDLETAEISVKAALTGHLVLSTLHTNDAASTFSRLTNMGVEPYLVTAAFNLAVAQRLVRCICENCKDTFDPPKELVETLGANVPPDLKFFRGHGCDRCHATGYKGRVALYEVMMVTDSIRDLVIAGCSGVQLKQLAIKDGMETLRGAGIKKMHIGKTTIEEVLSTTVADDK